MLYQVRPCMSLTPLPGRRGLGPPGWHEASVQLTWSLLTQLLRRFKRRNSDVPAGLQGGAHLAIGAGPNHVQRAVRPPQNLYLALLQVALLP